MRVYVVTDLIKYKVKGLKGHVSVTHSGIITLTSDHRRFGKFLGTEKWRRGYDRITSPSLSKLQAIHRKMVKYASEH
jgi:hypothetical protein